MLHPHSKKLIGCLIKLEIPDQKTDGKLELMKITSSLMPGGIPFFPIIRTFQPIAELLVHNAPNISKGVFLLVRDFCASLNVVRNMNEDQMIEAAGMLIQECCNLRLEDYVIMFSMAKRGELVDIHDRVDLQVITTIADNYWSLRHIAGQKERDSDFHETLYVGPAERSQEALNPQEAELMNKADNLIGAVGDLKNRFAEWKNL
jgi:hypothetical protein